MKVSLCAVALVLLLSCSNFAFGQSFFVHPDDPSAVLIGNFHLGVEITNSQSSGNSIADINIAVLRTSSGRTDYMYDVADIHFSGNGSVIDGLSTKNLFGLFGQAIVAGAITKGFTSCSTSCPGTDTVRVYSVSCVHRTGIGVYTQFSNCIPKDYCYRSYTYCCPSGPTVPQVTLLPSGTHVVCAPDSTGPCEPTCP